MEWFIGPRTQAVFAWCTESVTQPRQNPCNLLSLSSRPSSHSQPSSQPTLKQLLGSILDLWQSTSGWKEHTWTFRWTSLCELTCLLTEGWKMWHWKKKNADSLFSLIHLLFFFPRCEYDSMFVQDDVILNVDFFFSFLFLSGVHTGLQHALLLLLATIGHCVWLWTMSSVWTKQEVRKLKWTRKSCFGLLSLMGS